MNAVRKMLSTIREERVTGIDILDKQASLSRDLNGKMSQARLARVVTLGQESVGELKEMQEGECDWSQVSKERE